MNDSRGYNFRYNKHNVGVVSLGNSTASPLGGGGVFTGISHDIKDGVTVNVVAFSNVASATDGLSLQFSPDGINWDITEAHTVSAGVGFDHVVRGKARYFRVVYTNGAVTQTVFRLAVLIKNTAVSLTLERIDSIIQSDHDAALVRAVLTALKPNGDYTNIGATTGGNLKVSIEETNGTSNIALETGGNLDDIDYNTRPATNMEGNGLVSIGTTAAAIAFTGVTKSIIISALASNTGTLYVGKSNVTTAGANAFAVLDAGECLTIDYNDATNAVYIVASVAGQYYCAGALI